MDAGTRFAQLSQRFREVNPWVIDVVLRHGLHGVRTVQPVRRSGGTVHYHHGDALGVVLARVASRTSSGAARPLAVLTLNVVAICAMAIIGYPFNVQAQMVLVGVYTVGSHTTARPSDRPGRDRGRAPVGGALRLARLIGARPAPHRRGVLRRVSLRLDDPEPSPLLRRARGARGGARTRARRAGEARRGRRAAAHRAGAARRRRALHGRDRGAGRRGRPRDRPGPGRGQALAGGDLRDEPGHAPGDPPDPRRAAQRRCRHVPAGAGARRPRPARRRLRGRRVAGHRRRRRRAERSAPRRGPDRVSDRAGGAHQRAQARRARRSAVSR